MQGGLGRSLPSQRVLRWEGPDRESSGTQPEALRWSPGTAEARSEAQVCGPASEDVDAIGVSERPLGGLG